MLCFLPDRSCIVLKPFPRADFTAKFARNYVSWDRRKQTFESTEATRVARETQEREQQNSEKTEKRRYIETRYQEALREHPDLVERTQAVQWPSVVRYLLTEEIANGFKLGYALAKPENAALAAELIQKFPETTDPRVALRQIDEARYALGVMDARLTYGTPAPAAPPVVPVAAAPPAPTPIPPSAPPPRREEAAPLPVRGHGAPSIRPEDVNPMDSDARRALRGAAMRTNVH